MNACVSKTFLFSSQSSAVSSDDKPDSVNMNLASVISSSSTASLSEMARENEDGGALNDFNDAGELSPPPSVLLGSDGSAKSSYHIFMAISEEDDDCGDTNEQIYLPAGAPIRAAISSLPLECERPLGSQLDEDGGGGDGVISEPFAEDLDDDEFSTAFPPTAATNVGKGTEHDHMMSSIASINSDEEDAIIKATSALNNFDDGDDGLLFVGFPFLPTAATDVGKGTEHDHMMSSIASINSDEEDAIIKATSALNNFDDGDDGLLFVGFPESEFSSDNLNVPSDNLSSSRSSFFRRMSGSCIAPEVPAALRLQHNRSLSLPTFAYERRGWTGRIDECAYDSRLTVRQRTEASITIQVAGSPVLEGRDAAAIHSLGLEKSYNIISTEAGLESKLQFLAEDADASLSRSNRDDHPDDLSFLTEDDSSDTPPPLQRLKTLIPKKLSKSKPSSRWGTTDATVASGISLTSCPTEMRQTRRNSMSGRMKKSFAMNSIRSLQINGAGNTKKRNKINKKNTICSPISTTVGLSIHKEEEEDEIIVDEEDLDQAHGRVIAKSQEKVRTIDAELAVLGLSSPFRATEDIIPRFGELHHHLRNFLGRYGVKHTEPRRKSQTVKRRSNLVCRIEIVRDRDCASDGEGNDDSLNDSPVIAQSISSFKSNRGISCDGDGSDLSDSSDPVFTRDPAKEEKIVNVYFERILTGDGIVPPLWGLHNPIRELERVDCLNDLVFLANVLYLSNNEMAKGNEGACDLEATPFEDLMRPTSLCLCSGHKFEFLMSIFEKYGFVNNTNRNDSVVSSNISTLENADDWLVTHESQIDINTPPKIKSDGNMIKLTGAEHCRLQAALDFVILGDVSELCATKVWNDNTGESLIKALGKMRKEKSIPKKRLSIRSLNSEMSLGELIPNVIGWDDDSEEEMEYASSEESENDVENLFQEGHNFHPIDPLFRIERLLSIMRRKEQVRRKSNRSLQKMQSKKNAILCPSDEKLIEAASVGFFPLRKSLSFGSLQTGFTSAQMKTQSIVKIPSSDRLLERLGVVDEKVENSSTALKRCSSYKAPSSTGKYPFDQTQRTQNSLGEPETEKKVSLGIGATPANNAFVSIEKDKTSPSPDNKKDQELIERNWFPTGFLFNRRDNDQEKPVASCQNNVVGRRHFDLSVEILSAKHRMDGTNEKLSVIYIIMVENSENDEPYIIEHSYLEFRHLNRFLCRNGAKIRSKFPRNPMLRVGKWTPMARVSPQTLDTTLLSLWLIEIADMVALETIKDHLRERCIDFLENNDSDMKFSSDLGPLNGLFGFLSDASEMRKGHGKNLLEAWPADDE